MRARPNAPKGKVTMSNMMTIATAAVEVVSSLRALKARAIELGALCSVPLKEGGSVGIGAGDLPVVDRDALIATLGMDAAKLVQKKVNIVTRASSFCKFDDHVRRALIGATSALLTVLAPSVSDCAIYRAWIEDRANVCTELLQKLGKEEMYDVEHLNDGELDDLKVVFAHLLQEERELRTSLMAREATKGPPPRRQPKPRPIPVFAWGPDSASRGRPRPKYQAA